MLAKWHASDMADIHAHVNVNPTHTPPQTDPWNSDGERLSVRNLTLP